MPSEEELMGLAAHMGMLRVFISVKNSPDVIAFSHQHSSISEMIGLHGENKPSCKLTSKQKLSFCSICTVFLVLHRTYIPGAQI